MMSRFEPQIQLVSRITSGRNAFHFLPGLFALFFLVAAGAPGAKADKKGSEGVARLRIQVTGGDANKPVADASVYVKFSEERKLRKDKALEINLKTNQEGEARSPEIPQGKTLIQVIAPGWKTFGQWYDINESEQTIEIHLVRPAGP